MSRYTITAYHESVTRGSHGRAALARLSNQPVGVKLLLDHQPITRDECDAPQQTIRSKCRDGSVTTL